MDNKPVLDELRNTPVNLDGQSSVVKKGYNTMPFNGDKIALHSWVKGAYQRDITLQSKSRIERATDARFFDDKQFTDEEKKEYEDDGRMPPLQYNSIKQAINWILGTFLRQQFDWQVLPRTEDDAEPAIRKTKLMKYINDINSSGRQDYLAFADAVKTGEGWIEVAAEINEEGEQQIIYRHEHWRNIILDSSSRRPDASDANRLFRTKILDIEQLIAIFPEHESAIRNEARDRVDVENDYMYEVYQQEGVYQGGSLFMNKTIPYDGTRDAIRVTECWYKHPMRVKILRGSPRLNGYVFDRQNQDHVYAVQVGEAKLVDSVRQQVCVCVFTDSILLSSEISPYRHNRIPFVRTVAYIDDETGMPYGIIRSLRDPQMSMNVRRNKALHLLSTRRVIMEEGAVEDMAQLEQEVARADGIIVKRANKQLDIVDAPTLAESHIRFAQEDDAYIRQSSGVTGENLGLPSNATSGIAIQARQEQGTVSTLFAFENALWAFENKGKLTLSLIEQYIDSEMQVRITRDDSSHEYVTVNDGTAETDITRSQADFIVSKQNYHSTIRQALAESLLPLASTITSATGNPLAALAVIETSVSLTDIPNKDAILSGLRKTMGLPDPNESPEQKAQREQQQAEAQAKQQQMQEREIIARIAKSEADAKRAEADAKRINAATIADQLNAVKLGFETAGLTLNHPELATILDDTLKNLNSILPQQTNLPVNAGGV